MHKPFKTGLGLAAVIALAACTSNPTVQTGPDAETIEGRLYKVDGTASDLVYIDPTADFSRYNRVLLRPLGVDNIEIIQPSQSGNWVRQGDWELTEEDKAGLQSMYREAMVKALEADGGYTVSDTSGDDVLEIVATLTQIAPNAAKDDNFSRSAGRSRVYSEGSGSLSVAVAFGDSQSGEVLALSKDRRESSNQWGQNNRVSNLADVQRVFTSWSRQIRSGLDRVHNKQ